MIGRALGELVAATLAGFVGFFVLVAYLLLTVAGFILLAACGLASGFLLLASLFCGLGWFLTHKQHELVNAGGFLIEAAIPFTVIVVVFYLRDKVVTVLQARRVQRAALHRINGIRLVKDASHNS